MTPFDEIEVAKARAMAQERLAALTSQRPGGAVKTHRVALLIGNGAYKNVHPLDNPPRDTAMIADALKGLNFNVVTLANDLTRDQFFETLRAFAAQAERADWAVVYYAGHGFEIGGVNYLVPIDARLAVDKDAETEAVALEQVLAAVGGARSLRLVILDACRDNPFAPSMRRTIALKLVDKGFSNIEPAAGFMVVYAAKMARRRSTAMARTARSRPPLRTTSRSMSRCESCSTSSATTSGPRQNTSSGPSPTARRRAARIFTSRGNDVGRIAQQSESVIPGRCVSIEPGISRFPGAQLRTCGLVLRSIPE